MESVQLNQDADSLENTSSEPLFSPGSPDIKGVSGEPELRTRLGDKYQAEIPSMKSGSDFLEPFINFTDAEVISDASNSFLIGLPIPIMWVHDEVRNSKDEDLGFPCKIDNVVTDNVSTESRKKRKCHSSLNHKSSKLKLEPLDSVSLNEKRKKGANLGSKVAGRTNVDQPFKSKTKLLLPGSSGDPWKDAEVDSFLLGLYIFGKNFFLVKRFIENKEMGDILSYYYGEFYRSEKYQRWSDCRKTKCKKYIRGRRIFTGWRLKQFLARLHPHVPQEFQSALPEVSMSFADGTTSLEEYVSYLKTIVGIRVLVEAVGIGKGKEDLTGLAIEPAKTNQRHSVRATIPAGKDCCSLTSKEIIKLLTGKFQLSKARRNDIFWEAVWPRLLARGWHSEQPKYQSYLGSKDNLVFLMPGVKKFLRRELVKGDHYFDSVSGVLSKVASEPELLQLESDDNRDGSCSAEDGLALQLPHKQNDPSFPRLNRHLKPRAPKQNHVKFTIVDSSFVQGEELCKMAALRDSPLGFKIRSKLTSISREIEANIPKNLLGKCKADAVVDRKLNGGKIVNSSNQGEKIIDDDIHSDKIPDIAEATHMRFTIVNTSLIRGKPYKVSELRFSPIEFKVTSQMSHLSREDEQGFSENSVDKHEPHAADIPSNDKKHVHISAHGQDASDIHSLNGNAIFSDTENKLVDSPQDKEVDPSDEYWSKRTIKHRFSRRVKPGHSNKLVPPIKQQRLTACAEAEASRAIENVSGEHSMASCYLYSQMAGKSNAFQVGSSQEDEVLPSSYVRCVVEEESNHSISFDMSMSCGENEKHQPKSLVELNVPEGLPGCENEETVVSEMKENQGVNQNGTCFVHNMNKLDTTALNNSIHISSAEKQPDMKPKRQSTRNRPLTTKALEALETGFLDVFKLGRQRTEVCKKDFLFASPSQRSHSRIASSRGNSGTSIVDSNEQEGF
ncbi:hypothetical protein HS088_TW12G01072 [Tripterygium wilfordii]|uniref:SANT domain-containing protein n=2 Tax=Tripterygium wilfordii TaxID=458696 RepID=A0A7J7D0K0_TRIWF|nr:hypothetical protein HS088_TW12G01072 [Tripterygium wilfordii]